jgi:hypothetical protein
MTNQPNFQTMSQQELKIYMLAHRDNQEAFYAFVDKLYAEGNWIEMSPMQSEQDIENYPEFVEHLRRSANAQDKAI